MRILYVLKHNPWGIGGGCYACRNYLRLFSEIFAGADMDICICREYLSPEGEKEFPHVRFYPVNPRGLTGKVLTVFTGVMHRHQSAVEALLRQNHYDYCVFDHNSIAGTLVEECWEHGVKTIVINHNCERDYFRDNNTALRRMLFLHHVTGNERRSYLRCDYNIFLTKEDREQFETAYGKSATTPVVGGCFYADGCGENVAIENKPFRKEGMTMVISGTMGNVQNMDGICYFLDELLPRVPSDMKIVLAGKNPPAELLERVNPLSPRLTVVPNPENMDAVVGDCDIFVCPARLGGGMKLRVMDGFRNGLPVLAHAVSARGYREFEEKGFMREFATADDFESGLRQIADDIRQGRVTKALVADEAKRVFSFGNAVERIRKAIL